MFYVAAKFFCHDNIFLMHHQIPLHELVHPLQVTFLLILLLVGRGHHCLVCLLRSMLVGYGNIFLRLAVIIKSTFVALLSGFSAFILS